MLFISHKIEDKAIANEVLQRARAHGYSDKQIFLDSDPGSGIEAGAAWERKIYESLKHTRAMIVLCSPNWLRSQWCFVELGYAKAMAISIFPIVIEQCEVGSTLSATQAVDLTGGADVAARDAAFERLWTALEVQRLGPKDNLPWPPQGEADQCPFPGLMYFDEQHAPVYFGREPERDAVIRQLQGMRGSGVPRLLMIVGGSGSGKSSLLRAGVLPWLRHPTEQRDWLVLPTLRYGETPNEDVTLLARLAEVIAESYPPNHAQCPAWKELRDKFESDDVERAARDFVDASLELCQARRTSVEMTEPATHSAPTLLLAIDQFEELLTDAARPSAHQFLLFLRTLLSRSNGRLLVIGTMRSDYLDTYEQHAESLKPPFLDLYRLSPFAWERVTDVITKPAERVDVTFSEELITRLKGDAPTSDALPLLAFTLEKLFNECASDKLIGLREYEQLGGMTGAITQAVTRILPKDLPKETVQALRQSFVNHLAQLNEKDEFVRRRALWETLPDAAKPLLEKFVFPERLLQRSGNKGEIIEVTHEAIFRCWGQLKLWLQDDLPVLRLRRRLEVLAEEWQVSQNVANPHGDEGLLLTHAQLATLDEWLQQGNFALSDLETLFVEASREKRMSDAQREIDRLRQLADAQMEKARESEARRQAEEARAKEAEARQHAEQDQLEAQTQRANDALMHARKSKWFASGISVVALIAGGLGVYAISKKAEAEQKEWEAKHQLALNDLSNGETMVGAFNTAKALSWYQRAYHDAPKTDPLRESALRLLGALGRTLRATLVHDGSVNSAVLSPDCETVATACSDHTVRLWEAGTGKPRGEPFLHDGAVLTVAFSPDNETVLTGSADKKARLWDARSGKLRADLLHQSSVEKVLFSNDGHSVLTLTSDKTAHLWDVRSGLPIGDPLRDDSTDDGGVWAAAFSPDGQTVLTGGGDFQRQIGSARLWNAHTGQPMSEPLRHENEVIQFVNQAVAFSRDGDKILIGGQDARARVWNARTGQFLVTLRGHQDWVNSVAFSSDGKTALTGSADGTALIWNVSTGTQRSQPLRHRSSVDHVEFSPDGRFVLTVSDSAAHLWDAKTGKSTGISLQHEKTVSCAGFSSDGRLAFTGSRDHTVRLWNSLISLPTTVLFQHEKKASTDAADTVTHSKTSELLRPSTPQSTGITAVAFSPDGQQLLTGGDDRTARLWDIRTGLAIRKPFQHDDIVRAVAFSPSGHSVLTGGGHSLNSGGAWLWEIDANTPHGTSLHHPGEVLAVAFGLDGKIAITGGADKTARLWDVRTGQQRLVLGTHEHEAPVAVAAISADQQTVLTGTADEDHNKGRLLLWDVSTAKLRCEPLAHDDIVNSVAFSPDGLTVLSGSKDGTARTWDARTGKPQGKLLRHEVSVSAVGFSPDGKIIITGSDDGKVRMWDALTGQPLGTPLQQEGCVMAVAFNPKGQSAGIATKGLAVLFEVPPPASDEPEQIQLSVEVRTGSTFDHKGAIRPLKQDEWFARQRRLWKEFGGPCDVCTWDQISESKKNQLRNSQK